MRVVYDTSAIVIILARRGEILKFKSDVLTKRIVPITSGYILDELTKVLSSKFHFTKQKAKSHTRLYARIATDVTPKNIEPLSRDANDDPVLATAIAGRAEYIVTLDKDLLVLKKHKGILIVTPAQLKKLQG